MILYFLLLVDSCEAQHNCISWSITPLPSGSGLCSHVYDNSCTARVCLILNTAFEHCPKVCDTVSHMCDGSNSNGCPHDTHFTDDFEENTTCVGEIGMGHDVPIFNKTKCSGFDSIIMCQEGLPGSTLSWVVKDGDSVTSNGMLFGNGTLQNANRTCESGLYKCQEANKGSENLLNTSHTWNFTVPPLGEDCDGGIEDETTTYIMNEHQVMSDCDASSKGDPHCKYESTNSKVCLLYHQNL